MPVCAQEQDKDYSPGRSESWIYCLQSVQTADADQNNEGCDSDGNAKADSNAKANGNGNAEADGNPETDSNADAETDGYPCADRDPNAGADNDYAGRGNRLPLTDPHCGASRAAVC